MSVYKPEDMNSAFAEAFNSGNIENLLALYEPSAVLVPQPGQVVEGVETIRAALQELLALKGHMHSENQYALVHGTGVRWGLKKSDRSPVFCAR